MAELQPEGANPTFDVDDIVALRMENTDPGPVFGKLGDIVGVVAVAIAEPKTPFSRLGGVDKRVCSGNPLVYRIR